MVYVVQQSVGADSINSVFSPSNQLLRQAVKRQVIFTVAANSGKATINSAPNLQVAMKVDKRRLAGCSNCKAADVSVKQATWNIFEEKTISCAALIDAIKFITQCRLHTSH